MNESDKLLRALRWVLFAAAGLCGILMLALLSAVWALLWS